MALMELYYPSNAPSGGGSIPNNLLLLSTATACGSTFDCHPMTLAVRLGVIHSQTAHFHFLEMTLTYSNLIVLLPVFYLTSSALDSAGPFSVGTLYIYD